MTIRQLPETLINQIAAGEVIERPASVVKELVENALDAGARHIDITTAGGGISLIRVCDDGEGIEENELPLAIGRHCTSKLGNDISYITSLGFRGEALASIGSVSQLLLRSRTSSSLGGAEILIENGKTSEIRPAAANVGTLVEVRDLFFSVPARLKFMKGERVEAGAITETVKRIALAFPFVRFSLSGTDRSSLEFPAAKNTEQAQIQRIIQILGDDFYENSLALDSKSDHFELTGFISLPRLNRTSTLHQHIFVNERPVRDRLLAATIRSAYADLLPRERHPLVVLFLKLDPAEVDVNVHPSKMDVRFRDPGRIRRYIISCLRDAFAKAGAHPFSSTTTGIREAFRFPKQQKEEEKEISYPQKTSTPFSQRSELPKRNLGQHVNSLFSPLFSSSGFSEDPSLYEFEKKDSNMLVASCEEKRTDFPLGFACAHIHENYIIAETKNSMIIVDQHAAHERLVYEELKEALEKEPVRAQMLLSPEIVDLSQEEAERLESHKDLLLRFGLGLERFGPSAVIVRETPSILGEVDISTMIKDIADEISEHDTVETIKKRLHAFASKIACYGSVRSGRRLKLDEMNALLRQMEGVSSSTACNHGRPTYIELRLEDIEKLFSRR